MQARLSTGRASCSMVKTRSGPLAVTQVEITRRCCKHPRAIAANATAPIAQNLVVYFRQETRYGTATVGLPRRGFSEPGRMPVTLAKSSGPIRRSFDTSDLGPIYDGARTPV
jgi:hypothetical protein